MDELNQFLTSASGLWWPLLIFAIFYSLFPYIQKILLAFSQQILAGAKIKYGELEFHGVNIDNRTEEELVGNQVRKYPAPKSWFDERDDIYQHNRQFFLVHKIRNSTGSGTRDAAGRRFDIELSLHSHKGQGRIEEILYVEYYFGAYFHPGEFGSIYRIEGSTGGFAVITSAYGEFLCVAKITFKDGGTATLQRYVDFAMAPMLPKAISKDDDSKLAM